MPKVTIYITDEDYELIKRDVKLSGYRDVEDWASVSIGLDIHALKTELKEKSKTLD